MEDELGPNGTKETRCFPAFVLALFISLKKTPGCIMSNSNCFSLLIPCSLQFPVMDPNTGCMYPALLPWYHLFRLMKIMWLGTRVIVTSPDFDVPLMPLHLTPPISFANVGLLPSCIILSYLVHEAASYFFSGPCQKLSQPIAPLALTISCRGRRES